MDTLYHVFGLNIASSLPLPAPAIFDLKPDVTIGYGDTPSALTAPQITGVRFQVAPGEFLLRVDNVARFLVQRGDRITISPEPGGNKDDILPFLMGSVMGAMLQQRRMLVLHGSAIVANGESMVFCGLSGVGKSTLAAGLHKRGYPFLADDLCAISLVNGHPAVIPGFPRLKLWADTLQRLDTNAENLQKIRWGTELEKFFLPVTQTQTISVPVRSVYILETTSNGIIEVNPLLGNEKIDPLIDNSYRLRFLEGMGSKKDHFKQCATLAAGAGVFRIRRPKRGFLLEELMDLLEESFNT